MVERVGFFPYCTSCARLPESSKYFSLVVEKVTAIGKAIFAFLFLVFSYAMNLFSPLIGALLHKKACSTPQETNKAAQSFLEIIQDSMSALRTSRASLPIPKQTDGVSYYARDWKTTHGYELHLAVFSNPPFDLNNPTSMEQRLTETIQSAGAIQRVWFSTEGEALPPSLEVVGDSEPFSPEGTFFAVNALSRLINDLTHESQPPVLVYGWTGNNKHVASKMPQRDINSVVSHLLEQYPMLRKQAVGCILQATSEAVNKWGCPAIPVEHVLVTEPGKTWGSDILVSAALTIGNLDEQNGALALFDGKDQAFAQAALYLMMARPIHAFANLRPEAYDSSTGKKQQLFSAADFLRVMKDACEEKKENGERITQKFCNQLMKDYLSTHPFAIEPAANSTKAAVFRAVWNELAHKQDWWEQLENVTVIVRENPS